MNWKSLGHHCGSETFPWQLGLVSAEANCVLCLNLTDGNGAAPGCGLMLPPRLLKLSGHNFVPGEAAGLSGVS